VFSRVPRVPLTANDATAFATEVRRLAGAGEPPLYPAYRTLLEAAYGPSYTVDSLLRQPGAGFPDFTVRHGARLMNWIEVKHPGVHVDPLPAPDQARFDRYREALPHIVLTNGWTWRLFKRGVETDRCDLPQDWLTGARALAPEEIVELERFTTAMTALAPSAATSYDEAVHLLATAAQLIERAVLDAEDDLPTTLAEAQASFIDLLQTNPADPSELAFADFADQLAQACVFGYLMARVEAGREIDPYTAHGALSTVQHPFLQATLHAMVAPDPALQDALLGVLRTACDAVNASAQILAGPNGDWTNVPYVYEPFFAEYKPSDRFKYGVFYTPTPITHYQAAEIQDKLRSEFGLTGLTDRRAVFLDPACGTGTYLLALAELALAEAQAAGAPVASTLKELFEQRVFGFEVSPGPAAVAQARLSAWLRGHGVNLTQRLPIYTTNTLTPPAAGAAGATTAPANIWMANVSQEQAATDAVKSQRPVLVVFGNPPWGDRPRETFRTGVSANQNIIAEWTQGATGAVINLYDLYVAFWRFACQMLLERPGAQPPAGMVSYITNRSWLRGKAYSGMRRWLRNHGAEATVLDLGGDSRAGARADDEAVFEIRAGSAIATLLFRQGGTADVSFSRLRGTRREKLEAIENRNVPPHVRLSGSGGDPFGPVDWGPLAHGLPITKFFRGHFPGVKTHRDDLVIDVDRHALLSKIRAWNATTGEERDARFRPSDTHTTPDSHDVDPAYVQLHRYRPLDNRHLYKFDRFIDRPGTISRIYSATPGVVSLLTMDTRTTSGPAVCATDTLPGYNSFRGSYECHAFPLVGAPQGGPQTGFGGQAMLPDPLTAEARGWLAEHHAGADTEDLACFLLALGHAPSYAETFREALEAEIVRFPAVTDSAVFADAANEGRDLLEAWKLASPPRGTWTQAATGTRLGEAQILGDQIVFANGDRFDGIHPDTADFEISTYRVMERFLEARENLALTTELAEEVRKVAGAIYVFLDKRAICDALLARAIASPYVSW
jgi:hypothetical protein